MTIEDEAPLVVGKIYFLESTTNKTQRVGKLYKNPISLTDKTAWLEMVSYEFVCLYILNIDFQLSPEEESITIADVCKYQPHLIHDFSFGTPVLKPKPG